MNTKKSQEIKTPKYKVGDLVWLPIPHSINCRNGVVFLQTTIVSVAYSRLNGRSIFEGYIAANGSTRSIVAEEAVFATREEAEAFLDKIEAEVKAENGEE